MFKPFGHLLVSYLLALVTFASTANGMDSARTNVIKAGMINGFTSFTTWPQTSEQQPFVIGVMGGDHQFIPALERFFQKKPIAQKRQIQIRNITLEQVRLCQVVVLLGGANEQSASVLAQVADLPILTISDSEDFADIGGHVNFFSENNKLRFAINWKSTTRSRLKISSRLLRLARVVGERP